MSKIKEYRVVNELGRLSFEERVNACISNGWEPFGGVVITVDGDRYSFFQAMVKFKKRHSYKFKSSPQSLTPVGGREGY